MMYDALATTEFREYNKWGSCWVMRKGVVLCVPKN